MIWVNQRVSYTSVANLNDLKMLKDSMKNGPIGSIQFGIIYVKVTIDKMDFLSVSLLWHIINFQIYLHHFHIVRKVSYTLTKSGAS